METLCHQHIPWGLWINSWQMQLSTKQERISWILLDHYWRQQLRIGYLWSWTVDMQNIFQNVQINLEKPWDYWCPCMDWPTLESYFLMSWYSGCLKQSSFNINMTCLYTISMHQMEQKLLFYIIMMTLYIGILLKLLENGLWKL